MAVEDCLTALEKLKVALNVKKSAHVAASDEKKRLRASAHAWFNTYRPEIVSFVGENEAVIEIDKHLQAILRLTLQNSKRVAFKEHLGSIVSLLKKEIVTEVTIAQWGHKKSASQTVGDQSLKVRLENLSPALADCYQQVLNDLSGERISYRGTGNELREILREAIDRLAPDEKLQACEWFIAARKKATKEEEKRRLPTRAEKIRFILSQKNAASDVETAQKSADLADTRLGSLVSGPLYSRANAASHLQKDREEIVQVLKYVDAVLADILPSTR